LKAFEEARTVHNELVTRSFSDDGNASASTSAHRRDLSAVVLEMAIVLRRQGQIDEAMKLFKDALSLRREIELTALNDPAVALDVTIALVEYADALGIKGDIQDRVHVLGGVVEAREMLFRLTKAMRSTSAFWLGPISSTVRPCSRTATARALWSSAERRIGLCGMCWRATRTVSSRKRTWPGQRDTWAMRY
jgi:hypothetical protein